MAETAASLSGGRVVQIQDSLAHQIHTEDKGERYKERALVLPDPDAFFKNTRVESAPLVS